MKPRDISAYIFDLDGVIVDTAKYHYLAWKGLANRLGFDFSEKQNEHLKGVSRLRSLEIILSFGGIQANESEKEQMMALKNEWYLEHINTLTEKDILPGAKIFLHQLKSADKKIALGSASKNAELILRKLGLISLFDAIVDGTLVQEAKPNPEVFLKAAQLLGKIPQECVVFEDAQAGVEAALRAGMYCVGIGQEDNLRSAHIVLPGLVGLDYETLEHRLSRLYD